MQWSDPAGKSGIVEKVDSVLGTNSDSYPIEEKVRDGNLGLDRALTIIFAAGGRWHFDDGNHEDLPFIETALVQGQRDYKFATDEDGNLTLEIYSAFLRQKDDGANAGIYSKMEPVDQQSQRGTSQFWDGKDVQGVSNRYSKNGMSIILENPPSFSQDLSLKVMVDREANYFNITDTTKKPGFAGLFHNYIELFMESEYARANRMWDLYNTIHNTAVETSLPSLETAMTAFYGKRARDERVVLGGKITRFK